MLRPRPYRRRRSRRSLKTLDPDRDLPKPPVVHVQSVTSVGSPGAAYSRWVFDQPIQDLTSASGLRVNGHVGTFWQRVGPATFSVYYGYSVNVGQPWNTIAGAVGIRGLHGELLAADSGMVH